MIADEPTTALDVTIQAQVLELLRGLTEQTGSALILITHDLGVVAGMTTPDQRDVRGLHRRDRRRRWTCSPAPRIRTRSACCTRSRASTPRKAIRSSRSRDGRRTCGSPRPIARSRRAVAGVSTCAGRRTRCLRPTIDGTPVVMTGRGGDPPDRVLQPADRRGAVRRPAVGAGVRPRRAAAGCASTRSELPARTSVVDPTTSKASSRTSSTRRARSRWPRQPADCRSRPEPEHHTDGIQHDD